MGQPHFRSPGRTYPHWDPRAGAYFNPKTPLFPCFLEQEAWIREYFHDTRPTDTLCEWAKMAYSVLSGGQGDTKRDRILKMVLLAIL